MSLGLSGVSLNMNSKISLVPYLVAFISLENVLAITQSVISTPGHLDVKIRIAQGLSKEGTIHIIYIVFNLCIKCIFQAGTSPKIYLPN